MATELETALELAVQSTIESIDRYSLNDLLAMVEQAEQWQTAWQTINAEQQMPLLNFYDQIIRIYKTRIETLQTEQENGNV